MASRNRQAGHNFEREIVAKYNNFGFIGEDGELVPLFPPIGTTRLLSTYMDAMKVDMTTVDPTELKDFGLLIQAKNTTTTAQYPKLLKQLEPAVKKFGGIPIIYHKQTQRVQDTGATPRFMSRGEYVSLNSNDFEYIYTKLRMYKEVYAEFMNYFDSLPDDIQKDLDKFLKQRNL